MATLSTSTLFQAGPPPLREGDAVSDGVLLTRFIQHKDESAFEEIVRRHGLMVLGVCRRVLDNPHDAEDCFQAAFLVLVRKATTIQPREMVGNWLYGVAYRTALEARKMAARRRIRERKKFDMPRTTNDNDRWQELQPLLDQELSRLPDKYRFVVVACDIEGRTRKDVARSLEVPEGTVASRLARARTMLAKRLTRRNLAITAGGLAALLADRGSAAFVPRDLIASTTFAASRLSAGKPILAGNVSALIDAVVRSMLLAKLKIASAILLAITLFALGLGALLPSGTTLKLNPLQAAEALKKKPEHLHDLIIQHVDTGKMTIQAVKSDGAGFAMHDFQVGPQAAIVVAGRIGNLGDLQPGDCVNIEYQREPDGTLRAVRIETTGELLAGVVEAINDHTVTIQSDKDKARKTYDLDRDAWCFVNGKKSKLPDVKVKMQVALHKFGNKPGIVCVKAVGPKIVGVVTAIDRGKRSLTLGGEGIAIAEDAVILIDGKQGSLADIRAGMNLTVRMPAETDRSHAIGITSGK